MRIPTCMKCDSGRLVATLLLALIACPGCSGEDCREVDVIVRSAYVDWPFYLDCRYLEDIWKTQNSGVNPKVTNCSVTEDSEYIEPSLYEFNSSGNRTFNVTAVLDGTDCLTSIMIVRISPFPNITCQEFLDESKRNGDIVKYETTNGEPYFKLPSCPPSSQSNVASSALAGENFETIWMRSCASERIETYRTPVILNVASTNNCADDLLFGSSELNDGGEYVCSVKFKDKTLFVSSRDLCVKRDIIIDDPPSLICTLVERYAAGETGIVLCEASVPNGPTVSGEMLIEWKKGDTDVCSNSELNQRVDNGKHSCSTKGSNNTISCVYSEDEADDYTKKISLQLDIRDLWGNDFGEYFVKITYRGKSAEKAPVLSEDLAPFFARLAVILGLLFIVIALVVAAIIYYKRNTLEVHLRWIKMRGYENRGKRVFLSYFFDRFSMDEREQNRINLIVDTISQEVDCYDINRNGSPGLPFAEDVPSRVSECHTTLLVITSRFIECAERQFDTEQAFGQLLDFRKRMILVITPDAREAIQRRDLDAIWPKISIAIKILGAFFWVTDTTTEVQNLQQFITKHIPKSNPDVRFLTNNDELIYQNQNHNQV